MLQSPQDASSLQLIAIVVDVVGVAAAGLVAYFVFRAQQSLTHRVADDERRDWSLDRTHRRAEQVEARLEEHAAELHERIGRMRGAMRALVYLRASTPTEECLEVLATACVRYGAVVEQARKREFASYTRDIQEMHARLTHDVAAAILKLRGDASRAATMADDFTQEQARTLLDSHLALERRLSIGPLSEAMSRVLKLDVVAA